MLAASRGRCRRRAVPGKIRVLRGLSPRIAAGDRVLMTIATQCEARALAVWLRGLPARRKPWVLVLFPADRWNRAGAAERERQVAELGELGAELRRTPAADRRRLIL